MSSTNAKTALKEALRNHLRIQVNKRQEKITEFVSVQEQAISELSSLKSTLEAMRIESKHGELVNKVIELTDEIQNMVEMATSKLEKIEKAIASLS